MKNKTTTSKSKVTKMVDKKAVKSNTANGIETLPSGSYRVRKMISGKEYSCIFPKLADARAYRNMLNGK